MLSHNDAVRLLAYIAAYDSRTVGEADIAAFRDGADDGRWGYEEGHAAARQFLNSRPDDRLKPGHITEIVRGWRQDEAMRQAANTPRRPDDPRVLERVQAIADTKAVPDDDTPARRPHSPRAVPCPFCHAPTGEGCTRPSRGGRKPTGYHPARTEAANQLDLGEAS